MDERGAVDVGKLRGGNGARLGEEGGEGVVGHG